MSHTKKNAFRVVVTGLFSLFLLRKHFITEIFFKKKSGNVNDEANFSLLILLHKRAKPLLPPYLLPPLCVRTQTLTLTHSSTHPSDLKLYKTFGFNLKPSPPTLKIPPSKAF
jgi:hypothetical protein